MPKQRQFPARRPKPVLTQKSAFAPNTIPRAAVFRVPNGLVPDVGVRPHQQHNIPQGEHGGNGEDWEADKVGKPILAVRFEALPHPSTSCG